MKITVHGSGYVGLVTAACFASMGNSVVCVDVNRDRIKLLRRGQSPIHEPGLEPLLAEGLSSGRLEFTDEPATGVHHAGLQFIAVGTPPDEDGSADLRHVMQVVSTIATSMQEPRIVAMKSTVPVGTCDQARETMQRILNTRELSLDFDVVSNPEFLKEGAAINDFMHPARVVIGAGSPQSAAIMQALYRPFTRRQERMLCMSTRDAEFTKYAANAMLATRVSLMNEFAGIAERLDVDIEAVRNGIGSDPRIGSHFLYPGCGYGGSCFPKDIAALLRVSRDAGYHSRILTATEAVNVDQKNILFNRMQDYFGNLAGRTIALWGLAFKPLTDDMREAPSRILMESLWEAGAEVRAYDPVAMNEARRLYGDRKALVLCDSREAALAGADALAIVTEWKEFRSPDFNRIRQELNIPVIFDGRNLYDPETVATAGLEYYAIGRRCSLAKGHASHHALAVA